VTIEPLNPADRESFDALARIYEQSIPASERKATGVLWGQLQRDDYATLLARKDGAVIAFAIVFVPPDDDFALLEYMATSPQHGGQGFGGQLFAAAAAEVVGRPLLIEVDAPRGGVDATACLRRETFYRRLGCRQIVGVEYLLPLPNSPPPMDLFVYADPPPHAIDREVLRRWLRRIYTVVYDCPGEDPRLERMLHSSPPRLPVQ
jgi:GNAT superfamily N-acetyltransferase